MLQRDAKRFSSPLHLSLRCRKAFKPLHLSCISAVQLFCSAFEALYSAARFARVTPSVTTSLRSNVQSGSSHASSQTEPQHRFEGDESGVTREKVVFGVFAVLVMVVCAFVTYILCKKWILRCRNCSGGNSDVETGNAPHGSDDTELRDVNNTGKPFLYTHQKSGNHSGHYLLHIHVVLM